MKPTNALQRSKRKPLKVDPAKVRDWQNRSRQASLKRASKPLKQKPVKGTNSTLNRMSEKRRRELPERAKVRELEGHDDFPPHVCVPPLTYGHLVKSGQGGEFTAANGSLQCWSAQAYVEDWPIECRALGLVRQYEDRS